MATPRGEELQQLVDRLRAAALRALDALDSAPPPMLPQLLGVATRAVQAVERMARRMPQRDELAALMEQGCEPSAGHPELPSPPGPAIAGPPWDPDRGADREQYWLRQARLTARAIVWHQERARVLTRDLGHTAEIELRAARAELRQARRSRPPTQNAGTG